MEGRGVELRMRWRTALSVMLEREVVEIDTSIDAIVHSFKRPDAGYLLL